MTYCIFVENDLIWGNPDWYGLVTFNAEVVDMRKKHGGVKSLEVVAFPDQFGIVILVMVVFSGRGS